MKESWKKSIQKLKEHRTIQGVHVISDDKAHAGFAGMSKMFVVIGSALVIVGLIFAIQHNVPMLEEELSENFYDVAILAKENLNAKKFGEAIELFEEAIRINPSNEELYIGLADSYQGVNEIVKAREALEAGYVETKSDNIKNKLDEYNQEDSSEDFDMLMRDGSSALDNGDYELALQKFLKAIEVNPNSAEAYMLAADSCTDNNQAAKILQQGFEATKDSKIKERIEKMAASKNESPEQSDDKTKNESSVGKEESSNPAPKDNDIIEIKTYTKENTYKYNDTAIFESSAAWFELSESDSYPQIANINSLVKEKLETYLQFSPSIYGAETEEDAYNSVIKSGKKIQTKVSINAGYVRNNIVSYTVLVEVSAPDGLESFRMIEFHNINVETCETIQLNDILSGDEGNIKKTVSEAYEKSGIKLSESDYKNISFYLEVDRLVLKTASGEAYIMFADFDKFKAPLSSTEASKLESQTSNLTE